jgi:DNA-binding XRE family transcriptional regulator
MFKKCLQCVIVVGMMITESKITKCKQRRDNMKVKAKNSKELLKMIIMNGYTLRSLASDIEVSNSYLSQIVNGTRNPSGKVAKKIADALGTKFDVIFFIEDAC